MDVEALRLKNQHSWVSPRRLKPELHMVSQQTLGVHMTSLFFRWQGTVYPSKKCVDWGIRESLDT